MYYPCSENKGADQLRGYSEADLRLCFRLCRLLVFSQGGSYRYNVVDLSITYFDYFAKLEAIKLLVNQGSQTKTEVCDIFFFFSFPLFIQIT